MGRQRMPVTIGVFINPGHRPDQKEATDGDWGDRTTNRRVESLSPVSGGPARFETGCAPPRETISGR